MKRHHLSADGEVAGNPATHADQRRQAGTANLHRNMICDQRVEPAMGTRPLDEVIRKIRDVDDPDMVAKHRRLAADRPEPVLTREAHRLIGPGASANQRVFPSGVQAEDSSRLSRCVCGIGRVLAGRPALRSSFGK